MNATVTDHSARTSARTTTRPIWAAGLVSGAIAAVANLAIASVASALDHPLGDRDGNEIPLFGFVQMTLVGALLGIVIALIVRRRAAKPRRTFVRTCVALTAISCVPSIAIAPNAGIALTLIGTHVLGAAIVVPAIAGRLPTRNDHGALTVTFVIWFGHASAAVHRRPPPPG